MSKPVTNEEVEDVLSSIRRLVSEDKRPLAGLRSAPSGPAPSAPSTERSEKADKLVLTPSLRVAQTPTEAEEETQEERPLDLGQVARQTWIAPDASREPKANDEPTADDFQPESESAEIQAESHADERDEPFGELGALVQDAMAAEPSSADTADDDAEAEAQADWHDVALMHGDDTQEDEEDYDAPQAQEEDRDTDWAVENDDAGAEPSDMQMADAQMPDENAEPVLADHGAPLDETVPLTAKIAALETAIGAIRQDWEPDGAGSDDYAGSPAAAMAWEDDVDLDATGSPLEDRAGQEQDRTRHTTRAQEPVADTGTGLDVDDALMDEEALRDLVSEIVRSELQGALGERITRNVRKLVRREIHRALTAQEME